MNKNIIAIILIIQLFLDRGIGTTAYILQYIGGAGGMLLIYYIYLKIMKPDKVKTEIDE